MNNKKLGTEFERTVCNVLRDNGYWVHFMSPDSRGAQPFDIIAVKNGRARAIECKTLDDNRRYFSINRLEDNQIFAFSKWLECGNDMPQVFVFHRGSIHCIDYDKLKKEERIDMIKDENYVQN